MTAPRTDDERMMIEAFESSTATINGEPVPAGWWWLSFADPNRPEGTQFLGACLVKCVSGMEHTAATWLDLNPGGEIQIVGPIPDDALPPNYPTWELMSRERIDALDAAS